MVLYKNASVYRHGRIELLDVLVDEGRFKRIGTSIPAQGCDTVDDLNGKLLIPGFADAHVHLREPGFSYKETIKSGTEAAARAGYCALCAMPNVVPAPDCIENLDVELKCIEKSAAVRVYPYGTLTVGRAGEGETADYESMKGYAVGFSDDGKGVQSPDTMLRCMRGVKAVNGVIAAHCEDESLLSGGCVHDGVYAKTHGLKGISSESEWGQLRRDVELVRVTGCKYHACHISTKESVDIIRAAKREGLDVTCETAPHYLVLTDRDISDDGRFKMNPPIRSEQDRLALLEGIFDGTIDMIATDHAPHAENEKDKGLVGSAMGITGLECAFPILYTKLVLTGILPLEVLLELMCDSARARFLLPGGIYEGGVCDMAIIDLKDEYIIDPKDFASMGKSTPFAGERVFGRCLNTFIAGKAVYEYDGRDSL